VELRRDRRVIDRSAAINPMQLAIDHSALRQCGRGKALVGHVPNRPTAAGVSDGMILQRA
jgi:hypothetical protein